MKGMTIFIILVLSIFMVIGGQAVFAARDDLRPLGGVSAADPYSTCNSLVILTASDLQQMKEAEQAIVNVGGIVRFRFPPHIFYAWIPDGQAEDLAGRAHIDSIFSGLLEPTTVSRYGRSAVSAVQSWNEVFIEQTAGVSVQLPAEPGPIPSDALEVPMEGRLSHYRGGKLVSGPSGRGPNDTSEFMLGNVAITIILPESDGSIDAETESWTNVDVANGITDRPQKVKNEIINALNWWVLRESLQRPPASLLSFTLDPSSPRRRITGYEPIRHPSTDENLWISDILTKMGYVAGNAWQKVRQFDLDQISDFGADWAVTIFVCDSLNDWDGQFTDGAFAYSYLGGPWLTMTYDNNSYTIHNMDAVCAHESGHSFYTLDEYPAGSGTPADCHELSGYLGTENLNSLYDPSMTGTCDANYGCIMRGGTSAFIRGQLCKYSASHLGWGDEDGDGIYEILDFCPRAELNPAQENPTADTRPTFFGRAWIDLSTDVLPNNNPQDPGNDLTINTITKVEYRYQNLAAGAPSAWLGCDPDDGAFDGIEERYHFTVGKDLEDGDYQFEVRASVLGGHVQGKLDCPIDADARKTLTITTGPSGRQTDENPPECHTPYPPCFGLSASGPCYLASPTVQPTPDWATSRTVIIGCTFTDISWVDATTVQYRSDANGDYDYNDWGFDSNGEFWTEAWTDWDVEMPPKSDSRNMRVYAVVTYQVDGRDLHFEWRAKDIDADFLTTNGYTYSGRLNRQGMMDDWIVRIDSEPPHVLSASAADASGGGAGIQEGDTVTMRFGEETNGLWINETNIDTILYLVDESIPEQHNWGNCEGLVKSVEWKQTKWPNDTLVVTLMEQERCPGRIWRPSVAVGDLLCVRPSPTGQYIEDIAFNRCADCIYIDGDFGDSGGPVVTEILANGVNPLQVGVGTPQIGITAHVSDSTTGSSDVMRVELFVNLAGQTGTGTPMNMTPAYPPGAVDVDAAYTLQTNSWAAGTFTIYVHAQDTSGFWGDFSAVKIYVGSESIGCLYPPVFDGIAHAVDTRECGKVRLDWDEAEDINQPIVYRIYESRVDSEFDFSNPSYTSENLFYEITMLENNVPYYYVVRAEDSCGNEERNFVQLEVYPSDGQAPYFEGLSGIDSTGCGGLELVWTPATDDIYGCSSEPMLYNIYVADRRRGQDFRQPDYQTTAPDGVIITDLQHGAEYFVVVRAQDSAADYHGVVTGYDSTVPSSGNIDILIDGAAEWRDNKLVGSVLYPNIHRNDEFVITANTKTALTITSGYSIDTQDATVGSVYWVMGKGNEDNNVTELSAFADYAISNDEESWWLENVYPPSGSTVTNVDHLEFDILDDCFGVNKNSIFLKLDFNETDKALITDIWGGYHVEYYPEYYYAPYDAPYFAGDITVEVMAFEHSSFAEFKSVKYTFTALRVPESE